MDETIKELLNDLFKQGDYSFAEKQIINLINNQKKALIEDIFKKLHGTPRMQLLEKLETIEKQYKSQFEAK